MAAVEGVAADVAAAATAKGSEVLPDLRIGVAALATLWSGRSTAFELAASGQLEPGGGSQGGPEQEAVLDKATRVFATLRAPCCFTGF
eukprot:SAG22_NODE_3_length_48349_cov_158.681180_30_plen_88_part_00